MLVRLFSPLRSHLLHPPLFSLSQLKHSIFLSNYHMLGPPPFKKSRTVERLLSGQLGAIESLQGRLDPLRKKVVESISTSSIQEIEKRKVNDPQVAEYMQLYESLVKVIEACQINNEYVYNIISWYNMTSFYNTLLERLVRANQEEITYLVKALHAMSHCTPQDRNESDQAAFKDSVDTFYKRLSVNFEIPIIRNIDEILNVGLTFSKRKFFERYMQENMESLLKNLNYNDPQKVEDLIWLFEAAIVAMYDDEILISKAEKYLLTMRIRLADRHIERLMNAYTLKGRIQENMYKEYIKPYILNKKMMSPIGAVQCIKFLICSEANDKDLLQKCFNLFTQPKLIDQLDDKSKEILHIYTHYLRYKAYKININKTAQEKLNNHCKKASKDHNNPIGKLVTFELDKKMQLQKKRYRFANQCTHLKKTQLKELTPSQLSAFEQTFAYRLAPLDIRASKIYSQARFCCFQLQYCIHNPQTSELTILSSDSIAYAFSSGKLSRQMQIRDELLGHYGLKINHFNNHRFKFKGKMSQEEYLINRKVSFPRFQD